MGTLADVLDDARPFAILGLGLAAVGAMAAEQFLVSVLLLGIGNALFHVGGAVSVLRHRPGDALRAGVYVAPGALGVAAGILSATSDPVHRTVIDLIDRPWRESLHIAGRLDRASTGLVVLTNDGSWSKRIMAAAHAVTKTYVVETVHPIGPDAVDAFAAGFYFHTEGITTLPAELDILGERRAIVRLKEGRYHQIKRMFHRTGNRVAALHRMAIGPLVLDPALAPGEWRMLSAAEVAGM